MKRVYKVIVSLMITALLLVGCSKSQIKVGYTIYPVQFLLEKIGQDRVDTFAFSDDSMVLRSQLADNYKEVLNDVDVLFIMGELEPYMDIINQDIIDANTDIIDLSVKSGVFNFSRLTKVSVDNQIVDVKSNYYENPIFDTIDTYNGDPYLWMDPITMTSMAHQVRDFLVEFDPDNTEFYEENFQKIKMDLAYLDANFLDLRSKEDFRFATMTPSYGIWQNNYHFSVSPIILSKYGVLPTQQQLELIKVRLINDGVQYLIVEEDLDQDILDLANQLSEELELEQIEISNIASRSKRQTNEDLDYIQIMNDNLTVLEELNVTQDNSLDESLEEELEDSYDN